MDCCAKRQTCRSKCCHRRCIGTFTTKYKVYENCCYSVVKLCGCCGHEYDYRKYRGCPRCGAVMDDPPGDPPRFGAFGGGFGRFGRFGFPFRRRFFPGFGFGFGFPGFGFGFPEFEEEEEEDIF